MYGYPPLSLLNFLQSCFTQDCKILVAIKNDEKFFFNILTGRTGRAGPARAGPGRKIFLAGPARPGLLAPRFPALAGSLGA